MVHFPGFARARLWIHRAVRGVYPRGFPHSEIPGSMPACGSPGLIAACHVLHRLLLPRHPPCALSSLTIKFTRHTPASPSLVITNLHLSFRAKHPPEILSFRAKRGICFPFVQQEPRFSRHTPRKSHGPLDPAPRTPRLRPTFVNVLFLHVIPSETRDPGCSRHRQEPGFLASLGM